MTDKDDTAPRLPPEDRIIERYMPDASPEEKAEARENLHRLAKVLMRIEDRMPLEWWEEKGKFQHGSGDDTASSRV